MGKTISVTPETLKSTASYITEQAAGYKKLYEKLYAEVETMSGSWQGADNQAFTGQIQGFREDFDAMFKLMNQYSEFLTKSADAYSATQQELINQAKKLVN